MIMVSVRPLVQRLLFALSNHSKLLPARVPGRRWSRPKSTATRQATPDGKDNAGPMAMVLTGNDETTAIPEFPNSGSEFKKCVT